MDKPVQRILAVEDDSALLVCLQEILSDEGYQVLGARTGQQALRLLAQSMKVPDLLLLDYELGPLSGMNGLELYDLLHASSGFEHIPAIMVSGSLPAPDLLAKRSLTGLDKPYDLDHLLRLIEQTCSRAAKISMYAH